MFLIACPYCGPRAQAEFVYERTLDSIVPLDADAETAIRTLYTRTNPRGVSRELWRHIYGCRAWLEISRHTVTHEISAVSVMGGAP
jgi:heterotetrameric sarcosine oxidase delta subunit